MLPSASGVVDCIVVCDEYSSCVQKGAVQVGFTCHATLCTDECSDRNLVGTACAQLAQCDVAEIIKAETAAQCRCGASQLCGCGPHAQTKTAIATLDHGQRDLGIKPQCDINGPLGGSP